MDANEDKHLSYGWLKFRPRWLQFLNMPKWFLFFLSQYFFTQSIVVNGVYPGSISTIEKRFGFRSSFSGIMTSSYDVAALVLTPLISYIGGSRKKPVFCAWGVLTMGVGFFIFMLPHFISPQYEVDVTTNFNTTGSASEGSERCAGNRGNFGGKDDCTEGGNGNSLYYALFILGMVVAGSGCTPMYALGIPYVDENVKAEVAPMYVGIFVAAGIIGAATGFVVLSRFLSMFVELGVQTSLTVRDKDWVGNWWLGFAIFGAICVFWSIWLLGFPKEFPLTKKRRERTEITTDADKVEETGYTRLKDLPKATKLVFSRLSFLFITLGACMEHFGISANGAFMPKVIENQFYLPPGKSALFYGVIAIPSAFLGNLTGAYINKRLNLNLTKSARMCFIVALLGVAFSSLTYIKCETPNIAGVNTPYQDSSDPAQLFSQCNQACNCTGVRYAPVCGGPLTYFSPCHAGCSISKNTTKAGSSSYSNCTCVADTSQTSGEVTKGNCVFDCRLKFILFMIVYTAIVFLTFLNDTPALIVTLRSVPKGQQSYALGHQMNFVRLFGAIPGPIIYGALLDQTCILWSSKCGGKGFCLEYDHSGLAKVVVGISLTCKLITVTCFGLSWLFCRRLEERNEKSSEKIDSADLIDKDPPVGCRETAF